MTATGASIEDETWQLAPSLVLALLNSSEDIKTKKVTKFPMAEAERRETSVLALLVQSLLKASEGTAARAESVLDLIREAVTTGAHQDTGADHGLNHVPK